MDRARADDHEADEQRARDEQTGQQAGDDG
jgi:hypothetical protein